MKILGIIYLVCFLWMFFFTKIKVNGSTNITLFQRVAACLYVSLLLTIIVGIPVLGIMYLIGI